MLYVRVRVSGCERLSVEGGPGHLVREQAPTCTLMVVTLLVPQSAMLKCGARPVSA